MTRKLTPHGNDRLWRIIREVSRASEPTLHRIEMELGLIERPESPDAGRPWLSEGQPGGKSMEDS